MNLRLEQIGKKYYQRWLFKDISCSLNPGDKLALVGTNGLGQQIYIGLGDGDFGVGMTAGIGMAIIAMIADRMTQAVSRRKQAEYGLSQTTI